MVEGLATQPVAGADPDFLEAVEHVQFGERDAGDARHRHRLAHQHRIEPAAAALAPRHRAEFAPDRAEPLADRVVELGGEGTGADPGRVSLDDAEHEPRGRGAEAGARRGGPGDGVGGSHERIGAMIDVEQHPLRAFEEDAPAARARLVKGLPDRPGELENEIGDLAQITLKPRAVDARLAEAGAKRVVMRANPVELGAKLAEMGEIADPDRAAAGLVLISGADAAPRGADLARARSVLAKRVEIAVKGQDQRAGVGDLEIVRGDCDALRRRAFPPRPCSAQGSSTTPLPITDSVPRTIPEGSRESL